MICTTTAYRTVTSALEAMSQTQACHLLTISSIPCRRQDPHRTGKAFWHAQSKLFSPTLLPSGDFRSGFRFSVSWNKAMLPCPVEKRVSEHSRSSCKSQKQVQLLILFSDPSGPSTLAGFLCLVVYILFKTHHDRSPYASWNWIQFNLTLYHFMEVKPSAISSGQSHSLSKSLARHNRHQDHPEQPGAS